MRKSLQRSLIAIAALSLVFVMGTATGWAQELSGQRGMMDTELFPPNAKPGGCYTRVFIPPTYQTVSERFLKTASSDRVSALPPQFRDVSKTIVVKEASERLEIVPAEYKWVEETVLIKPEYHRLVPIPAVFETKTEKVLDRPAHTVWKKGRGLVERVDNTTGEIMCLVEIPATYKTVRSRVLKSPATFRTVDIPAKFKTEKRRVMTQPPTTRLITIPAVTKTVNVTELITPAQKKLVPIDETYQTVTRTEQVTEGRMAWQTVLCETNMTRQIGRDIQTALKNSGHHPGPIDGVIGKQTLGAVRAFQGAEKLPRGGLTLQTLRALKVSLPWATQG